MRFEHDVIISNQRMKIDDLEREVEALRLARGRHVAALEQIRSMPKATETMRQRYHRCVRTANEALDGR